MAIRGSADVEHLLLGGFNILGTVTQLEDNQEAVLEETHALGDAWREFTFVGIRQAEISQQGFYDDAANSVHEALSTGPGVSRVLTYAMAGTATGAFFTGHRAMEVNYQRQVSRGALHKAQATYRGNGRFDQGRILFPHKNTSATAEATGTIDNAVSSTLGGAGYFQLSAFTSAALATAVVARVQHSSDNITYADLAAFTAAAAAPTAERIEINTATAIERFLRMASSFQGGAAGASAVMFVGFARY